MPELRNRTKPATPSKSSAPKEPQTTARPSKGCCSASCCGTAIVAILAGLVALYYSIPYVPIFNADLVGSSSAKPIVVYCERTVKDEAAYAASYAAHATSTQAAHEGVRAMFSFMEKEEHVSRGEEKKALQFGFFDGPSDVPVGNFGDAMYAGTAETDKCIVYGGWTEELKAKATAVPNVHYSFQEKLGGFIRGPGESYLMDGPIMVFISKRVVKTGMRDDVYQKVFQRVSDMMFPVAPGLIAAFEIKAEDDPDHVWSLRIFNDYYKGFLAHIYGTVVLPPTIALTMVPLWGGTPGVFPTANSFSTQGDISGAVAGFPGNAVYNQYTYPDIIGPMPDFKKGK